MNGYAVPGAITPEFGQSYGGPVMRLNGWNAPAIVAALLLVGAMVWSAGAQNGAGAPASRVATVDLTQVIEELDERGVREQELQQFINLENQKLQEMGDRLEQAQADLDLLVAGSPERRRKAEDAARIRIDLEVQNRFAEQLIDRRRAEVFATLFEKIDAATEKVAQEQGIDLVLLDDSDMVPPRNSEGETRAFMGTRRIMYASETIDITELVVVRMNNEWNAGG